jgi:predicted nucleic acid-binding protein
MVATWWATELECFSALARIERWGTVTAASISSAIERLDALAASWAVIEPSSTVRTTARRLLRVHDLRASDALQLAAAIVAAESEPATLPFVTLDDRQARAAEREGFMVVRPDR